MWSDDRWIRGVAALEPTYVRNDEASLALTWLAASPDDVELCLEGRCRSSRDVDLLHDDGPEAVLVLADGSRISLQGRGVSGGGFSEGGPTWGRNRRRAVHRSLPVADVEAIELAWPLFRLRASVPLPASILRDAAARAVARG